MTIKITALLCTEVHTAAGLEYLPVGANAGTRSIREVDPAREGRNRGKDV